MKIIGLIESNFTGIDAIVQLKEQGFKVAIFTSDLAKLKSILPVEAAEVLDRADFVVSCRDTGDRDELLRVARAFREEHGLDLLYTFAQPRIVQASWVARELGLPGCDPNAVFTASNKRAMRVALAKKGLSPLRTSYSETLEGVSRAALEVGFPCVVKPCSGHSSIGVALLKTAEDLLRFVSTPQAPPRDGVSPSWVVEEWVDGPLYSIETLTTSSGKHEVWGACDRILEGSVEVGASFPVRFSEYDAAVALVTESLDAIGFDLGPAHTEIIVGPRGPRIVEINPRAGGSGVSRLIERATGGQVPLEIIRCLLGENRKPLRTGLEVVSMRSVLGRVSGKIRRMPTPARLKQLEGVEQAWLQRNTGDHFVHENSNFSSLLTLLGVGRGMVSSRELLERNAELALEEMEIV